MLERTRFRQALPKDAADQAEVFHHAIMEGASGQYTLAQRRAWAMALPRTAIDNPSAGISLARGNSVKSLP